MKKRVTDKQLLDWIEMSRAKVEPYAEGRGVGVFTPDGWDCFGETVREAIAKAMKRDLCGNVTESDTASGASSKNIVTKSQEPW